MPGRMKRCKVKTPTTLALHGVQSTTKKLRMERSYKTLSKQLKENNYAMAKALAKKTQAYQDSLKRNTILTARIQELSVALIRRDNIISGVLKRVKESQQLSFGLLDQFSQMRRSCEEVVMMTGLTPRKSAENAKSRTESTTPMRNLLSRLNKQKEYDRIATSPNFNNIEEVLTTPEQSSSRKRWSISRRLNCLEIEQSPGTSSSLHENDVDECRSSVRNKRDSGRISSRRSQPRNERKSSKGNASEVQKSECPGSPTVTLKDVSWLLPNTESNNIRKSLDNSFHANLTKSNSHLMTNFIETDLITEPKKTRNETIPSQEPETAQSLSKTISNISESSEKTNETDTSHDNSNDHVKEPRWLQEYMKTFEHFKQKSGNHESRARHEIENCRAFEEEISRFDLSNIGEPESLKIGTREVDDEGTSTFIKYMEKQEASVRRILETDYNQTTRTSQINFVTRKRSYSLQPDDFTLLYRHDSSSPTKNCNFGLEDLVLPVLINNSSPRVTKEILPPYFDDEWTQKLSPTFLKKAQRGLATGVIDDDILQRQILFADETQ